jgi:2,3-bisphosphoglycerate-independent phosphoglycerate mutase
MKRKVGLIILDGWGIGNQTASDAVFHAKTPFMDMISHNFPHAELTTHGEAVGLPEGQMGNSEVGHLNIGAGRIVYQELTRINKSIREGSFFQNETLLKAITELKSNGKNLHLLGLVSEGGVHSSQNHLNALCDLAKNYGIENVFIHAITDGRDCDPKSGLGYIQNLQAHLKKSSGKIASIIGRYYAMDRDNRWERVKKAYDLLTKGIGKQIENPETGIEESYTSGTTDEFIEPMVVSENGKPVGRIEEGDTVIFFNFRTDRPRELTIALTQRDFPEYEMEKLQLNFLTMTSYDSKFENIQVIFEKDNLNQTLGEIVAAHHLKQLRVAETEKYPHVTFFFNGGKETPFVGESRILVNSPKVSTYDLQPQMSAPEVATDTVNFLKKERPDFFCLNFANPDMVGHTGIYNAIIKAVETVDACLEKVCKAAQELDYEIVILADHGNADFAINEDGSPNTAHSLNPVPIVLMTKDSDLQLRNGILADVAPTVLDRMGIQQPQQMTGKSLKR